MKKIDRYIMTWICYFILPLSLMGSEIPRHLKDLRELQENVLPQDNSYRHSDQIVEWKGYHGAVKYICHADCSGLIDALLMHSYNLTKETMGTWLGRSHAKAREYYKAFSEGNHVERIVKIKDLVPGDFVAMKYLPQASDAGHDTGHIMVINALPKKIGPRVHESGNFIEWSVEVIDCSHGHGISDTRYRDERYWPGIGKGTAALYSDREGNIVGYSWTPGEKSIYYDKTTRPLAVGRFIPDMTQKLVY